MQNETTTVGQHLMTLSVHLFARARDLAGTESLIVTVPDPATVGDVRRALLKQCPALVPLGPHLFAAVNSAYADDRVTVSASCEIAFFPPVSGG